MQVPVGDIATMSPMRSFSAATKTPVASSAWPAIQLEKLIVETIRARAWREPEPKDRLSDREAIDRHVTRITVRASSIDVELKEPIPAPAPSPATETPVTAGAPESACPTVISLPWSTPAFASVKGVVHQPEAKAILKQETRDAILAAVAKARSWIEGIASGRVQSFAEIAEREGKVERHIRLLTPLAFIPPRTLAAIVDGTGPHDATVTALAHAVPYRWNHGPAAQVTTESSDGRR
jgi:site-specific DNA recombinase